MHTYIFPFSHLHGHTLPLSLYRYMQMCANALTHIHMLLHMFASPSVCTHSRSYTLTGQTGVESSEGLAPLPVADPMVES